MQYAKSPQLHWLTVGCAAFWPVLFEVGLASAAEIREGMGRQPEEMAKLPEAWQLLQSHLPGDLVRGLHLLSNHVFEWQNLGPLLGHLLEGMVVGDLSVQQVICALHVITQKVQSGEFTFAPQVIADFALDPVKIETFPARLDAIENGQSTETLEELRASVDEWLAGYASL